MINAKDVITLKIPYPSIDSDLAIQSHMYICKDYNNHEYQFFKCQSWKPYMINNPDFQNFIHVLPDNNKNPFRRKTSICCDKLFRTINVSYQDILKCNRNVCDELFLEINNMLNDCNYKIIDLDENNLINLNHGVSLI